MWINPLLDGSTNRPTVGHTKVRCKAPPKDTADGLGASAGGEESGNDTGNDFDTPAAAGGVDEWETQGKKEDDRWETTSPVATAGGW